MDTCRHRLSDAPAGGGGGHGKPPGAMAPRARREMETLRVLRGGSDGTGDVCRQGKRGGGWRWRLWEWCGWGRIPSTPRLRLGGARSPLAGYIHRVQPQV
ncbi:unnamed protein product [Lampetra planeri]